MTWDPSVYGRFHAERSQPFFDLLDLVERAPKMRVVDLGCGTGELTRALHDKVGAAKTVGYDLSADMLRQSASFASSTLAFEQADIETLSLGQGELDLVFANASLHWLPDHPALFRRLTEALAPHGQLAVQVPANFDHPSHTVAREVADEAPFRDALEGRDLRFGAVLGVTDYAELLHGLGFRPLRARLEVYGHVLASREDVVEWVKGTNLTPYKKALPEPLYRDFVETYRDRLMTRLADSRPFFFPFKRILMWGRKA